MAPARAPDPGTLTAGVTADETEPRGPWSQAVPCSLPCILGPHVALGCLLQRFVGKGHQQTRFPGVGGSGMGPTRAHERW